MNKSQNGCDGCIHRSESKVINYMIHVQFCMCCKRALSNKEKRDVYKDFYKTKNVFDEEID